MPTIADENLKQRRRRPERQLYVPPAQRSNLKNQDASKIKIPVAVPETKKVVKRTEKNGEERLLDDFLASLNFLLCRYFLSSSCTCNVYNTGILQFDLNTRKPCLNFRDIFEKKFSNLMYRTPLVQLQSSPALNVLKGQTIPLHEKVFPLYFVENIIYLVDKLAVINCLESYLDVQRDFNFFCDCDIYFIKNDFLFVNNHENLYNHYFFWENILKNRSEHELLFYINEFNEKRQNKDSKPQNVIKQKDCNLSSDKTSNVKKSGHEEEIEIMRKTKENINRKIRPIMKYVERTNDTLDIKINDIKDWEELLNDDGEFREDLLEKSKKNSKRKSSNDAKVDNCEDVKQIEELEHMVELYDFPPSFKTNDLIQAFSTIESDAMYVKWVDDTHAILVLGSLTQALKAINLDNPLIKARPMSMASKTALATANKNDLKPAMKRPQTSLLTARRFISAHLGMKVGVSREVMTKERDDLKAAREMKKISKQNERDAWEGNLRSSIN